MRAGEGFAADKAPQCLDVKRESAEGEGPLSIETAAAESLDVLWHRVFGTIDDTQILATASGTPSA
jgi:hypothetical protein